MQVTSNTHKALHGVPLQTKVTLKKRGSIGTKPITGRHHTVLCTVTAAANHMPLRAKSLQDFIPTVSSAGDCADELFPFHLMEC